MDPRRFDSFTQSLATAKTRRGLLGGIVALVAGVRAASAQDGCPPGQTRNRKGECRCPSGTDACPDGCFDTKSDPNNCGACGNQCSFGAECRKGECRGNESGGSDGCRSDKDCGPGFVCYEEIGACSPSESTGTVFDAPAARVWQALTDAETLATLGISTDVAPLVGHRFRVLPAPGSGAAEPIEAEVVEVEELRRFAFAWLNGPLAEPTTVTVTLDPVGDGSATRLRLAHTDPSGKSCRAGALVLGRNWGQRLLKDALPRHLARRR